MSNKRTDRQTDSFRAPQTDSYRAPQTDSYRAPQTDSYRASQCGVVIRNYNNSKLTYIVKPKLKPLHFERNENDAACL